MEDASKDVIVVGTMVMMIFIIFGLVALVGNFYNMYSEMRNVNHDLRDNNRDLRESCEHDSPEILGSKPYLKITYVSEGDGK